MKYRYCYEDNMIHSAIDTNHSMRSLVFIQIGALYPMILLQINMRDKGPFGRFLDRANKTHIFHVIQEWPLQEWPLPRIT